MLLQRRYSVTGQTPPDEVGAVNMKSPQLQAGGDAGISCTVLAATKMEIASGGEKRGRKTANPTIVRTSSKRSATQLPSLTSPSQALPVKQTNCVGLGHEGMDIETEMDMDEGSLSDPFPEESDWALSSYSGSTSASFPPSPVISLTGLSDDTLDEGISLEEPENPFSRRTVDKLALSLPPSSDVPPPRTLLTLPLELRHQIYRNLPDLVLSHPLIYCLSTFKNNMQHPLASVSRVIRSEALAIFYSYNTWIIKLEFKIMYDAFQDWIIRLGDGAGSLRLVTVAVRGSLFKPRTSHSSSIGTDGQLTNPAAPDAPTVDSHPPSDGDASFKIDLSEKWAGGRVEVERNDGTKEAGEKGRIYLRSLVEGLWEKRRTGTLNGQDWVDMVDSFLSFTGWW